MSDYPPPVSSLATLHVIFSPNTFSGLPSQGRTRMGSFRPSFMAQSGLDEPKTPGVRLALDRKAFSATSESITINETDCFRLKPAVTGRPWRFEIETR